MRRLIGLLFVTLLVSLCHGQEGVPGPGAQALPADDASKRPLPDVATLMLAVEAHQRADEAKLKDYIFRETETLDEADGKGGVKKRTTRVFDVFWLQGVRVRKMVSKDGVATSAEDLRKEDERIDKEVKAARERRERKEDKGKQTDSNGNEEVPVSRILELGTFANARRVQIAGRDTIAVDYAGDAKAKTRNKGEEAVRDLAGTVWVDEQDKELARTEGRFVRSFKIGGGLVVNLHEGTNFTGEFRKVNGEVWLPTMIEARGAARFLLFVNFNGSLRIVDENFRKFKSSATLLPGVSAVEDQP